ncbi:hypothetical protein SDC9_199217 [bioreactor metagenome]|uniref:Uncharacterized protein n=1 Tax=bioreactor metagenome TaxID=1076179 RepID=A0A645IM78_9ZZZZ
MSGPHRQAQGSTGTVRGGCIEIGAAAYQFANDRHIADETGGTQRQSTIAVDIRCFDVSIVIKRRGDPVQTVGSDRLDQ